MGKKSDSTASATGLYQYIAATGAIFFPGTPVHKAIIAQNASVDSVMDALTKAEFDLTGADPKAFKTVLGSLIQQAKTIAALGTLLASLTDSSYSVPSHGTRQLQNLFDSAKAMEKAINLHIKAEGLVALGGRPK
jgi:hypothetical protein